MGVRARWETLLRTACMPVSQHCSQLQSAVISHTCADTYVGREDMKNVSSFLFGMLVGMIQRRICDICCVEVFWVWNFYLTDITGYWLHSRRVGWTHLYCGCLRCCYRVVLRIFLCVVLLHQGATAHPILQMCTQCQICTRQMKSPHLVVRIYYDGRLL